MGYRKRDADTQLGRKDTLKVGHTLAGGAGMGMGMGNGGAAAQPDGRAAAEGFLAGHRGAFFATLDDAGLE